MKYPDEIEYTTFLFSVLESSCNSRKRLKKRKTRDVSGCFAHRVLRCHDPERDYCYAGTTRLLISSSVVARKMSASEVPISLPSAADTKR